MHNVRAYKWIEGMLEVGDTVLATFEEALDFAERVEGHLVKIFDHNNLLVHEKHKKNEKEESYA